MNKKIKLNAARIKEKAVRAYSSNKESIKKYKPYFNFVKDSLEDLSYLQLEADKWDLFSTVRLAHGVSKIVDHYNSNFKNIPASFSYENNWHYIFSSELNGLFFKLLKQTYQNKLEVVYVSEDDSYKQLKLVLDDLIISWSEYPDSSESNAPTVYLFDFKSKEEKYYSFFAELFNKSYPFNKIKISMGDDKLNIHEELFSKEYVQTQKVTELIKEIENFINYGYNRSYLFYGPPGSGKTNIINGLMKEMDAKSLKFEDISSYDDDLIVDLIRFIRPKVVVFEDVDHMDQTSLDSLLASIEKISSNCNIILASANEISRLDNALVRPERFDRLISVDKLEPEVVLRFVNNDKEIFELVKNFPAVYIKEFMKRVNVLGKQIAMDNSEDLFERIENLGYVNYSISKGKKIKSTSDEEEEDDSKDEEEELEEDDEVEEESDE